MLSNLPFIQDLHLPTQQAAQLRADDLLLGLGFILRTTWSRAIDVCAGVLCWLFRGGLVRRRGFTLADAGSGEGVFLVDGVDGALEAAEEGLGAEEGGGEVDGVGELVHCREDYE